MLYCLPFAVNPAVAAGIAKPVRLVSSGLWNILCLSTRPDAGQGYSRTNGVSDFNSKLD